MSERAEIAKRIFKFCSENGLTEVYGDWDKTEVERNGKKSVPVYSVIFSKRRVLDGDITIYGKSFMLLKFQTAYRNMPQNDSIVFRSEENLINFIEAAFVDLNGDAAYNYTEKENK